MVLIDTLSENSYAMRHIPGAISVPFGPDFVSRFEEAVRVSKDAEIIAYCASETCHASAQAADALKEAGYGNVKHYAAGIAGWQEAGYSFQ